MKKLPLLLYSFLIAQPALADEEALSKCRQIQEVAARAACYDRFVDAHYPMGSGDSVETSVPAVPDAQSLFGTNDAEAKRIVETSLAIEQIDRIEAVVTEVRKSANEKLTVTLDNGQVWRQLDSKPMRLKSGETVIVRKASLGSFLLEKSSGSRSIRVKRAD